MRLTILIPVLNFEETLEESVKRIRDKVNPFEILLLWDVTKSELKERIENLSRKLKKMYKADTVFRYNKKGFGSALRLGFKEANGDVIVVTMGDMCDDYKTIGKMMEKIGQGYDVVVGCRYIKGGGIIGNTVKQKISKFISILVSIFSKVKCRDVTNAFKAYRKEVLATVKTESNSFDVSFELTVKAAKQGYKIGQVPSVWKNRDIGKSNFNTFGESKSYLRWFLYSVFTNPSIITKSVFAIIVLIFIYLIVV